MGLSFRPLLLAAALTALAAGPGASAAAPARPAGDAAWLDLLDLHGAPTSPTDRSFNIFFDAGAWHGYSLPPIGDGRTGFSGPFVHSLAEGRWVGARFAELALTDAASGQALALVADPARSHAGPGYLVQAFAAPGLAVRQTLYFADSWRAVARVEITGSRAQSVKLAVLGRLMANLDPAQTATLGADAVVQTFAKSASTLTTRLRMADAYAAQAALTADGYSLTADRPLDLKPGQTAVVYVEQSLVYDAKTETPPPLDEAQAWTANRRRWAGYQRAVSAAHLNGLPAATARRIAAKAEVTLLANWRAARGDLRHDGVVPSYSNPDFNGFWAWDSWKHVAALSRFAPDLARSQMRALIDYQAASGMVPDCIYLNRIDANWRNTKPPLAVWALLQLYRATGDKAFLAEIYPHLARYHRWWFANRDHDHTGLAEYGSSDGTRIAAAWESGMDNAVRFDGVTMLQNSDWAWSADQQSVDLNAYLYREALDLAKVAGLIGKAEDQRDWLAEAAVLKPKIQARFYDARLGWFFDARLKDGDLVRVYGSEGWSPLWAGAASPAQARAVARTMLDPAKFATLMPFPTLAADDARFSPIKGYWRGPVWLDQAQFGVEALRRYGYGRQADAMARRLALNAKGLTAQAPFYENYDPLTGQGYQSANFSWAAAHYLLMLEPQG